MSPSQLFGWRRKEIRGRLVEPRADADRRDFVEVSAASTSLVKVCLGDIVIRTGADVDFNHLLKVISPGMIPGVKVLVPSHPVHFR